MVGMVERAKASIELPEVQKMIEELSKHGLGVFMPHLHTPEGFAPLPPDKVQLEGDLKVSFVDKNDPQVAKAMPVGWVWDKEGARVATACFCTGAEHSPHWNRPR